MAEELPLNISAKNRYSTMEADRMGFLSRARECALLTIPAIMPPQGFSATSKLPTPYQSLGARGIRTLASKLLLSLYPGIPFYNYKIDDLTLAKLGSKKGEMDIALAARERSVTHELDTSVFRPAIFVGLLQLIATGNVGVYIPPKQENRAQVFRLDQYVTRRDAAGRLLEWVIMETTELTALAPEHRVQLQAITPDAEKLDLEKKPVELFTHGYWNHINRKWEVYQEAKGIRLAGTDSTFNEGDMPYLFLRFATQPGEHYGRSYVEEYLGDLDSLEALSELLVEGSAASGRVVFMVNPSGVTSIKVVAKAKNGDVVSGDANDVTVMQVQKQADLQVAKAQAEEIANRLSYAFLLHSSVQRQGERVTAEEIRFMASELDDGLGGVYTLLAADLQLPSVRLFEVRMEKRLGVQKLPSDLVKPTIVTGLEAIGRGHNQANLRAFVTEIIQILGPELAMQFINPAELISRAASSYSIPTEGLMFTPEEREANAQKAQQMEMLKTLGPQAVNAAGGMGKQAMQAPPQ
jgi:hypothetical protein